MEIFRSSDLIVEVVVRSPSSSSGFFTIPRSVGFFGPKVRGPRCAGHRVTVFCGLNAGCRPYR